MTDKPRVIPVDVNTTTPPDGFNLPAHYVNQVAVFASNDGAVRFAFGETANGSTRYDMAILMTMGSASMLRDILTSIIQAKQAAAEGAHHHDTRQ